MKSTFSRRNFIQSSAAVAAACAVSSAVPVAGEALKETGKPNPIKLGLCSYSFRNFARAQLIDFMKQLKLTDLNVDRKSTRLNSSHSDRSRMPSSA